MQEKLIAWRRFNGLTQNYMAEKLGITLRTYQNKEYGDSQFKANEMFAIANILNKEISDIFLPVDFK